MCSTSYRPQLILLMMAMFVMFSTAANAELKHVSPMGFVSTHELFLNATPAQSYSALVDHVGEWWDASHSFAGQAQAFMIDDVAGGCFCEVSGDIRVQHMHVHNLHVLHPEITTHFTKTAASHIINHKCLCLPCK